MIDQMGVILHLWKLKVKMRLSFQELERTKLVKIL